MEMTIKEILIWLMTQNVTYHQLFKYLKQLIKVKSRNNLFTLNDLKIIHQQMNFDLRVKRPHLNFTMTNEEYVKIKHLASISFMIGEKTYPENWLHLPQPPIVIFYQGNLDLLLLPMISMIGTRKMTDYGKQMTHEMCRAIVEHNICVVSGLALGVDQLAHQTAIQHQGRTIGITACGLNHFYPRENLPLQMEMMAQQLVLSEYLPDTKVKKHHFVMRNRLVAGLTPLTVVIEAANGSGSLITANYAIQFDRELLVLPGRITDSQSHGCNELIYHGATPIISIPQAMREIHDILKAQLVI